MRDDIEQPGPLTHGFFIEIAKPRFECEDEHMTRAPDPVLLRRAARLYRIPGVTQAEVCARLGISRDALKKARAVADLSDYPWPQDLIVSMLTDTGRRPRGPWPTSAELGTMASYCDFVDKNGATADTIAAMLEALVEQGILSRRREGFLLLVPFP